MDSGPIKKQTGLRHLFAAAQYSQQGFVRLLKESAFRHELLAFVVGLVVFALIRATIIEFLIYVVLMMVLFATEALNTAISSVGKHAKDLGSFAVFCMLIANGLFAAYVVISSLLS
jgi:diacylglycerol kinase (ATP)